jgi:hypothetical protein
MKTVRVEIMVSGYRFYCQATLIHPLHGIADLKRRIQFLSRYNNKANINSTWVIKPVSITITNIMSILK